MRGEQAGYSGTAEVAFLEYRAPQVLSLAVDTEQGSYQDVACLERVILEKKTGATPCFQTWVSPSLLRPFERA